MASVPRPNVNFRSPPVSEVALHVQFAGPVIDANAILGGFWPEVKERFVRVELQPLLPPIEESFEIPSRGSLAFQMIGGVEIATRYLLMSEDDTELLQVQPDRFAYHWRKPPNSDIPYPRYPHVRKQFLAAFETFCRIAESTPVPTWCEIVYANPVPTGGPGEPRADLSTVLRRIAPLEISVLPPPYNMQFAERFQLERDGKPFSRFFIEASPTFWGDVLGYQLALTMRGEPQARDQEGVAAFFDEGREKIVNAFQDITTEAMHDRWERA